MKPDRIRVVDLAALLGVTPAQVLATCRKHRMVVAAPESMLDMRECEILTRELGKGSSSKRVGRQPSARARHRGQGNGAAWNQIAEAHSAGRAVKGVVTELVKGGLTVDIGVRAFLPGSEVDVVRVPDLGSLVGTTINARIIEFDLASSNVVLSRRAFIEDERLRAEREKVLSRCPPGQVVEAAVARIRHNGLVVELDEISVWVPLAEIPLEEDERLSTRFGVGQRVGVTICDVDAARIVGSLRAPPPDDGSLDAPFAPAGRLAASVGAGLQVDGGALVLDLSSTKQGEELRLLQGSIDEAVANGISELRVLVSGPSKRRVREILTSDALTSVDTGSCRQTSYGFEVSPGGRRLGAK